MEHPTDAELPADQWQPFDPAQPFTNAQAVGAGISPKRLRGPSFRTVHHGVHVSADAPDCLADRCAALLRALPTRVVFSHRTAALLLGLPVDSDGRLHVTCPPDMTPPRRPGVRAHTATVPPVERAVVDGVPVTIATRTFVDLAQHLARRQLIIVGDTILRRGLATPEELAAAVAGARRRRGVTRARAALPELEPRTDSPSETIVRLTLTDAGLPRPHANVDVYSDDGRWLARPDLLYPQWWVAIEYDGVHHVTDIAQRRRDIERERGLRDAGWEVVVLTVDDLRNPAAIVRKVRAAIARAAARTRPPYVGRPLQPLPPLPLRSAS